MSQTSQGTSGAKDDTRLFAYDTRGEILERRRGTVSNDTFTADSDSTIDHYAYVDGQPIGSLDEGGGIHVLGSLTGFSSGASRQSYVVQAGDTLAGIAQAVYGNSQYGYLVAEANGLTGDSDLVVGQAITLPSITTSSNAANTFKPYDPGQIVGSTTPSLPLAPPPPSQAGCSTLAMIVVIAVVVVATVLTAGAAAVLMGAQGGLWAAGGAALAGGAGASIGVGEAMLAAAAGGFAGSVAGQLTGDALGVSHGFSLKEALGAGLGAGLTAGLGGEISGGAKLSELSAAAHGGSAVAYARIAGIGAASAVGNYAGEKLVNEPAHFSWVNVAAAAVGTEATTALHLPSTLQQQWGDVAGGTFASDVVGGLVNGAIDSETTRLLGGRGANSRQITEDAFGNALGNMVGDVVSEAEWKAVEPSAKKQIGSFIGGVLGNDPHQEVDFSHVDPLNQAAMWAEIDAEKPVTQLSDVVSDSGNGGGGLTAYEKAHLATTTAYSGTYVDPYLIERNSGKADWSNTVQTFEVPDDPPVTVRDDVFPAEPSTGATPGSIWSVTASAARGIWHGFNYSREAIASYIADQAIAFNQGGIDATVIGHTYNGARNFVSNELTRAHEGGLSSTETAQALSTTLGFLEYVAKDRSLSEDYQGAVGLTSNLEGSAINYYGTHSAEQIAYDVGNFVGEQVPLFAVTAGAGTAARVVGELGDLAVAGARTAISMAGDTLGSLNFVGSSGGFSALGSQLGAVGDLGRLEPLAGGRFVVPDGALQTGPYGTLVDELKGTGLQANHLNQNAAFRTIIPSDEGVAVGMRGNAFTEIGSPHYEFHSSLESFWQPYRRGGELFGSYPTNAQYGEAVTNALRASGLPDAEAVRLSELATQNRAAYGLLESQQVPGIPGRLPQVKPRRF